MPSQNVMQGLKREVLLCFDVPCLCSKLCKRYDKRGLAQGGDVCALHQNRKSWKNIDFFLLKVNVL